MFGVDFDWHGCQWLESHDNANSVFAFIRLATNLSDIMVVVCDFTPVPRDEYRVGVPTGGPWPEVFKTDASLMAARVSPTGVTLGAGRPRRRPAPYPSLSIPPLGSV